MHTIQLPDGVAMVFDSKPTHVVVDLPGADMRHVHNMQKAFAKWYEEGGVIVMGGGDPDREPVTVTAVEEPT